MICETTCGYCRKEVKSAHGIEAVYIYFKGSGIWGGETMCHIIWRPIATSTSIRSVGSVTQSSVPQMSVTCDTLADNIGY